MPDLETRLRRHAERHIPVPDFDDALSYARSTSELDGQRTKEHSRRTVRAWCGAAAAVIAVGGGVTAIGTAGGRDERGIAPVASPRAASTAPFTPTVVGMIIAKDRPDKGGPQYMLFSTSPRATTSRNKSCIDINNTRIIETATQVRVRVVARRHASGVVPCETQGLPDPRTGELLEGEASALKAPLGHRTVVDDLTGRGITVFRPTYPRPTYVPVGYSITDAKDVAPMGTTWSDPRPGFLAPMSVARRYGPRGGWSPTRPSLVVVQAPYDSVNPGATVIDHVSINGHDATVTDTTTTRCVTWSPDGQSGIQVCFDSGDTNHPKPALPLSVAELVRMARSIR